VWSNICINFGAEQGILLNIFFSLKKIFDDLVLLSESQEGLQNCLNKTWEYCKRWGLEINYTKSKVMIFNKGSRLSNVKFYIDEIVRHYKYLGIMQSLNGSFTQALL
jgi:hypothetical protein